MKYCSRLFLTWFGLALLAGAALGLLLVQPAVPASAEAGPAGMLPRATLAGQALPVLAGNGHEITAREVLTTYIYMPLVARTHPCPTSSSEAYGLLSFQGPRADRPDYLHADLNLGQRGYTPITAFLGLVDYTGSTDPNAPYLGALFVPNGFPGISAVYQVQNWDWSCGSHGCPAGPITNPPVTLAGFNTAPGQPVYVPGRGPEIWPGYIAMVLYADEQRITLNYTRQDTVALGYAVHLENVCVDPNLLALYRAQTDGEGWHVTGRLPGLRRNQALGTAVGAELRAAIRDRGTFLDPRSRKDWW